MNRCVIVLTLLVFLAAPAAAQVAYVADVALPGAIEQTYLPSSAYPIGAPGLLGVLPYPAWGPLVPTPLPLGGMAIDQSTGLVYVSDGFTIVADHDPAFWPFVPPPPPPPAAPAPIFPTGAAGVTGMGADVPAGILWMTDGFFYGATTLLPPYAWVLPPIPLPFPPVGGPLSGIDIDLASGTLWGCDLGGNVYQWLPGAGPVGPVPFAVVPIPAGGPPLMGLAVNDTNGPGSIAPHFCSLQLTGYHVVVTEGLLVWDALNPANPPIPIPSATGAGAYGIAGTNDFQLVKGTGFLGPFPGAIGWDKAITNGPGGANMLRLAGGPPLTTAIFLYDLCPVPGGLLIPASGETLWINPFSPTFATGTFITDLAGNVHFPVNFTWSGTGLNFVGQWAVFSPVNPLGYALSDMMQFICGTN